MNVIEIKGLEKSFKLKKGVLDVLKDISLNIKAGSFVSIVGINGSGKTTLLNLIARLSEPTSGEIIINNNGRLSFIFQNSNLAPWRNVMGNICLPLEILGGWKKKERQQRAFEMMDLVGLSPSFNNFLPSQLSDGMQQRAAIARALITDPNILLMDEPFSALDEPSRDRMDNELLEIWQKLKPTILFVSHSSREAMFLSQKIVVLSDKPTTIRDIIDVDFSYPRRPELYYDPKFIDLLKKLRNTLKEVYESNKK